MKQTTLIFVTIAVLLMPSYSSASGTIQTHRCHRSASHLIDDLKDTLDLSFGTSASISNVIKDLKEDLSVRLLPTLQICGLEEQFKSATQRINGRQQKINELEVCESLFDFSVDSILKLHTGITGSIRKNSKIIESLAYLAAILNNLSINCYSIDSLATPSLIRSIQLQIKNNIIECSQELDWFKEKAKDLKSITENAAIVGEEKERQFFRRLINLYSHAIETQNTCGYTLGLYLLKINSVEQLCKINLAKLNEILTELIKSTNSIERYSVKTLDLYSFIINSIDMKNCQDSLNKEDRIESEEIETQHQTPKENIPQIGDQITGAQITEDPIIAHDTKIFEKEKESEIAHETQLFEEDKGIKIAKETTFFEQDKKNKTAHETRFFQQDNGSEIPKETKYFEETKVTEIAKETKLVKEDKETEITNQNKLFEGDKRNETAHDTKIFEKEKESEIAHETQLFEEDKGTEVAKETIFFEQDKENEIPHSTKFFEEDKQNKTAHEPRFFEQDNESKIPKETKYFEETKVDQTKSFEEDKKEKKIPHQPKFLEINKEQVSGQNSGIKQNQDLPIDTRVFEDNDMIIYETMLFEQEDAQNGDLTSPKQFYFQRTIEIRKCWRMKEDESDIFKFVTIISKRETMSQEFLINSLDNLLKRTLSIASVCGAPNKFKEILVRMIYSDTDCLLDEKYNDYFKALQKDLESKSLIESKEFQILLKQWKSCLKK